MKNERVEFKEGSCIERIEEKCTHCGVCKKTCNSVQNIGDECIKCGQCILSCPMGALVPRYDYQTILNFLNDTDYTCIISIAPAARSSLTHILNLEGDVTKKFVGILRSLGFDYVYDVAVGADLTTIEESMEFIDRFKSGRNLPLMTSCCPSWKKYAINHGLDKYISSTKSPIKMQGYLVKKYVSKYIDFKNKIINIFLMPCVSKKEEILDSEDIDFVLTTSELVYMINESKINISEVKESDFDYLLGNASSSGIMYGTSGGVLESVVKTCYYLVNNEEMNTSYFNECLDPNVLFYEKTYDLNKFKIKTCKVSSMSELQKVDILNYDLIEVMACPGGCINGGGQPLTSIADINKVKLDRCNILLDIDRNAKIKNAHNSKEVEDVYSYLVGTPGGTKAHKDLHD